MQTQKPPNNQKESWERKTVLEESGSLPSDYTTKLQYLKYGTGGGMEWEFGVSRSKWVYIEWISKKVLLYSTGNYIQYPVINHNGKGYKKECIYIYN